MKIENFKIVPITWDVTRELGIEVTSIVTPPPPNPPFIRSYFLSCRPLPILLSTVLSKLSIRSKCPTSYQIKNVTAQVFPISQWQLWWNVFIEDYDLHGSLWVLWWLFCHLTSCSYYTLVYFHFFDRVIFCFSFYYCITNHST